jgi:hypothetical protein
MAYQVYDCSEGANVDDTTKRLMLSGGGGGGCNHMPEELEVVKDGNIL